MVGGEGSAEIAGWRRGVALAALAQLLSVMGYSGAIGFLALYIQTLGVGSPRAAAVWAGVMLFAAALVVALCSPLWGALADRYGAKLMVGRALFGGAAVVALMSAAGRVEHLLALFCIQGLFTGINTAITTLVAGIAPRDRLGAALGLCQTAIFVGVSIGPIYGGLLADAYSYRLGILGGAALLLLAGLIVLFGVAAAPRAATPVQGRAGLFAGIRPALASRPLLLLIALIFLVQFSTQMIGPVLPVFVQDLAGDVDRVATLVGLILAAGGVTAAGSAILLGRAADRLGHRRVLAWSTLGGALAVLPQAFVGGIWPLLALRALSGLFAGGLTTSTSAAVGLLAPPGQRGAALGMAGSAFSLGNAFGPLLGGALAAAFGPRVVFGASGLALAAGWLVVRVLAPVAGRTVADPGGVGASPGGAAPIPGPSPESGEGRVAREGFGVPAGAVAPCAGESSAHPPAGDERR